MGSEPPLRPKWLGSLASYLILSLIWLAVLAVVLWVLRGPTSRPIEILPPAAPAVTPTRAPSPTPPPLHVDVTGAVAAPGVYVLPSGSIVADAIRAAGGPAGDADLDRINKAVTLQDGMQVNVPRVAQAGLASIATPPILATAAVRSSGIPGSLVNVNMATQTELEALPGIGPAMALKIIDGRPYGRIEDLLRVPGIGQTTLNKLAGLVTVQ